MSNLYDHREWIRFREQGIKLDGGRCVRCNKALPEVVLQLHHRFYVKGRKPWEYEYEDCETLCKGCHAQEHGIIMPQSGWTWEGTDDLVDLIGNCELCDQEIRYVYAVSRPNWVAMAVGTDCCDRLTGTTNASEYHDQYLKRADAKKRFVGSKRWMISQENLRIRQKGIDVLICLADGDFIIRMDGAEGKKRYSTIFDAKIAVFDSISSGEAAAFLARRRERSEKELRESLIRTHGAKFVSQFKSPEAIETLRRLG